MVLHISGNTRGSILYKSIAHNVPIPTDANIKHMHVKCLVGVRYLCEH